MEPRSLVNKIPDEEDKLIYDKYISLIDTITHNAALIQITKTHIPKRAKATIERSVERMKNNTVERITNTANARINNGEHYSFYTDPTVQMKAIEILANVLGTPGYEVGDKQFQVAKLVETKLSQVKRSKKELPV
jgi:hypothetical protein